MVSLRAASAVVFGLAHLCAAGGNVISPQQVVDSLKAQLSNASEVVLASDPAYASDFTHRFSNSGAPSYVVAVKPAVVADVQKVVRFASRHHVPFLPTGGGHGYSWSLAGLAGGIDLDLGNFQTISVDTAANTMTLGGAVRLGNLTHELHAVGKEFTVGMCPTVGVGGFTLGGGVGPLGGFYGTASDSLLSAEVVTGTGEILNVSATSRPDLFYGLRGAGFNYGIATSLKYRVYPATNAGQVTIINAFFPGHMNASVWQASASYTGKLPKELTVLYAIRFNATAGGMVVVGSFIYAGPEAKALQVVKPWLDLNPLDVEIKTATYANYSSVVLYGEVAEIGPQKGINFAPYTVNLYKVDVENLASVFTWVNATLTARPELQSATLAWAQFPTWGFKQFPVSSSAFPYRDVAVYFSIDGFSADPAMIPTIDKFSQEIRAKVQKGSGKPKLEAYVNFGHGDEGPAAWYSAEKLPRLLALKAAYDPWNLFGYFNGVVSR